MAEQPKPCHSIGIQWGFFWWQESSYGWIGGSGVQPPPSGETVLFSDNFNDNSFDTVKWGKYEKNTGILQEANQRLEQANPADGDQTMAYTKQSYNVKGTKGGYITAKLVNNNISEVGIMFFNTLITTQFPTADPASNGIFLSMSKGGGYLRMYKRVAGANTVLYTGTYKASSVIKIEISELNVLGLYVDDVLVFSVDWMFAWTTGYVYLHGVGWTTFVGIDYHDDFKVANYT